MGILCMVISMTSPHQPPAPTTPSPIVTKEVDTSLNRKATVYNTIAVGLLVVPYTGDQNSILWVTLALVASVITIVLGEQARKYAVTNGNAELSKWVSALGFGGIVLNGFYLALLLF